MPTEGMQSNSAQRLIAHRPKTTLPVSDKLLDPEVITGVEEKLRFGHQIDKSWYDRLAKDLPRISIRQDIRIKPLPGDRSGKWRRGVYLKQMAPRSYLVNVEETLYPETVWS